MTWSKDTVLIQGEEIDVKRGQIKHTDLKFFVENLGFTHSLSQTKKKPEQASIESRLIKMDHVKDLVQSIKKNGGLMEPIFVHEETYEVLEGNSRLAAYRRLSQSDPVKWSMIKCVMLPKTFEKNRIFAFLGQLHIVGKKDWAPFEQAGFLYRRHIKESVPQEEIARDIGLALSEVKNLIKTYEFMHSVGDTDINKWSYYYEFNKSRKIGEIKKKNNQFESYMVDQIKSGEIKKAADVRDIVPKLAVAKASLLNKVVTGGIDLYDAVETLNQSGDTDQTYNRLRRFRNWFVGEDAQKSIAGAEGQFRNKILYELGKIEKKVSQQITKMEKKK